MSDNNAQTESVIDIVKLIQKKTIMLPEFQRDFRWEMEQTFDLFDSLARDIFIGTIIYGKPSFALSCRQIDFSERKPKQRRKKVEPEHFSDSQIKEKVQTQNFRIVLDGQQRITSIVRAVLGIDDVYMIASENPRDEGIETFIDNTQGFSGSERGDRISINLHHIYRYINEGLFDEDLENFFLTSSYVKENRKFWDDEVYRSQFRLYRRGIGFLADLLKREKVMAYYLLDMNIDKFCTFFERSNSRGIQLDFTDILAAKLYVGFNLRRKIEEFENDHPDLDLNREIIVRAIAFITSEGKQVEKGYILKNLKPSDFIQYWDEICGLYVDSLNFLRDSHFILSQSWMPSENMLLPIMIFLREIGGVFNIEEEQRRFLEYWFWSSIFSARYSTASNEVIIKDAEILTGIAKNQSMGDYNYLARLRPVVTEWNDVLAFKKKASSVYKGFFNLINYHSRGILDWTSQTKLTFNQSLHDHHIFPRAFVEKAYQEMSENNYRAEDLVDCVANRALIPKITNIKIGSRSPANYLAELQKKNSQISVCLESHCIDETLLDPDSDKLFFDITLGRARTLFELVNTYAIQPSNSFTNFFPPNPALQYDQGQQ